MMKIIKKYMKLNILKIHVSKYMACKCTNSVEKFDVSYKSFKPN